MNPWLCNLLFNNSGGSSLPVTGQTFYASLKTSLVPEVGTGGPTWSRATAAWRFNDLGYLRQIPSGCADFGGARLVVNTVRTKSEDFSNAAWVKSAITTPSTNTLLCANATSSQNLVQGGAFPAVTAGQSFVYGIRAQYVVGGVSYLQLSANGTGFGSAQYLNVSLLNGSFNAVGCTGSVTLVATGVYDIALKITAIASGNYDSFAIGFANSLSDTRFQAFVGDGVKSVTLLRAWSVDVTGRDASYVPEYVSVGADNANELINTEDATQSSWIIAGGVGTKTPTLITDGPNGVAVNGCRLTVGASTSTLRIQGSGNVTSGRNLSASVYVRKISGSGSAVIIDINDGSNTSISVSSAWVKAIAENKSHSSSSTKALDVSCSTASGWVTGDIIEVCYPQYNYGSSVNAYNCNGPAYSYSGAGADGCKYFATDWQGAPIPVANLTRLRKETAGMNALLWSRDLSNAAWSTKTNITAAKTATGLDGIANSASTLTATSADAIILQPITLASAARCASTYVRRKTGTGTISFTQDGGSTWADITSQLNSTTYTRVQITATLANPSVGFKISTSGDAIDVDCVQNEAGAVATSPIVTTTATVNRSADSLTDQTSSNWSDTAGTAYILAKPVVYSGGAVGSATNGLLLSASNSGATAYDGTNSANGPTGTPGAVEKLALAWGSSTMSVASSGLVGTPGTYDGAMGLSSIGVGVGAVGYFGDVAIYNYKMTDAELQAITT